MKKIIIIAIFLFSAVAVIGQKKTIHIGMLMDVRTSVIDTLVEQLRAEIKHVVGEDAAIVFSEKNTFVNNYDLTTATSQYNTLLENETDLILAFGIVNNELVQQQKVHQKPTILLGTINRDLHGFDQTKQQSGIHNLTYLIEAESYRNDLTRLMELRPFKKVGIIIEKKVAEVLPLSKTFDKILPTLGADYKLIPFQNSEDIYEELSSVDAVYLAGGFLLTGKEVEELAASLISKKISSFTTNGAAQVEKGILATNIPRGSTDQIIRRVALTVSRHINGAPLSEMPVYIDYKSTLTINYNTAEAIGVDIKYSMISQADFVGEFKTVEAQNRYSLLEAIDKSLGDNIDLGLLRKDVALSAQEVKMAKSNYLPSLSAGANLAYTDPDIAALSFGQTPEFQTSGNVTLQQTVFSESANAAMKIQKSLLKAEQERLNTAQLNTVFSVSSAYFNALIFKTNAEIQLQNLEVTKRNFAIAEQNLETGLSDKSDLLRLESQIAQQTQVLVESVNQLDQAYLQMNQLLNNPTNTKIDVEDIELNEGIFSAFNYDEFFQLLNSLSTREALIDFFIEEAKRNAPELKSLVYNMEANNRTIKLNREGRFLPTIGMQGQYTSVFDRDGEGSTAQGIALPDNFYNVGVNVSIPIFNQNRTRINKQNALIRKDQLDMSMKNSTLAIEVNIRRAVLNLTNQISNIETSKLSEHAAEEALKMIQSSYANGAVNIVQLIDAQNNLLTARLAKANAIYNYLIGAVQIERSISYYFILHSEEENRAFMQRFLEYTKS